MYTVCVLSKSNDSTMQHVYLYSVACMNLIICCQCIITLLCLYFIFIQLYGLKFKSCC